MKDKRGSFLSGATVGISIVNQTVARTWTGSGTTGSNGAVTFSVNNAPSGTYVTTVNSVVATGMAWDGATPSNSYTK